MLELKPVVMSLALQGDEKFVCLVCHAGFAIMKENPLGVYFVKNIL